MRKSGAVASKGDNHLQLKDRDYFESIGLAPSSNRWNDPPSGGYHWNDDDDN